MRHDLHHHEPARVGDVVEVEFSEHEHGLQWGPADGEGDDHNNDHTGHATFVLLEIRHLYEFTAMYCILSVFSHIKYRGSTFIDNIARTMLVKG